MKYVQPVIHVRSWGQVSDNIQIAEKAGADGIWLICHGNGNFSDLLKIFYQAKENFPSLWFGLNFLDMHSLEAMSLVPSECDGLWTDNAEVFSSRAMKVSEIQRLRKWPGRYFGGVQFKYQKQFDDIEAAKRAKKAGLDVLTTSGAATGSAPSIEKIEKLKETFEGPLAIASGLTPTNVKNFSVADYFMVATGVSVDFYRICPEKLSRFVEAVKSL